MAGTGASASNHGPLSARIFMHQQQADIFPNGRRNDDSCVALRSLGMRPLARVPSLTVRRADDSRDIGPFARLVRECLRLVGASYADPVALINEVGASAGTATVKLSRINP